MQLGAGALAAAACPAGLNAWQGSVCAQERPFGPPRRLTMHNLNTGEMLDALYWDAGAYVPDALAALNKLMRDHHTGEQHVIAPALLDALSLLHGQVEANACYELICGYRAPGTNAAMHRKSRQVANNSLHLEGMAADVRINGVSLEHLQKAALVLRRGGVGLYPKSGFVHVDVGPVRHWQGT
ncbi:MAG TPA: DUF882 domain-containing protein [Caulobacteraceae bacterium]|nr:DUF882 domain-containing protein [Caulobacteraceae bacterium]